MTRRALVAILGATATGKSALALALAERFNGEIINCDSTAVYRGFDIGTDKLPFDERRGIPHHLIDIAAYGMNQLRFTCATNRRIQGPNSTPLVSNCSSGPNWPPPCGLSKPSRST